MAIDFPVLPLQPHLRRNEDVGPPSDLGDRLADDLFRPTEAVDRSRVDRGDAVLERRMDCGDRLALVGAAPPPIAQVPRAILDTTSGVPSIVILSIGSLLCAFASIAQGIWARRGS